MTLRLQDGLYPFIDQRLPLSELAMVEAPPQLEALFKAQAAANALDASSPCPPLGRLQASHRPRAPAV